MSNDIVKFEFHGDVLDIVPADTRHCVVVRSITDALGLDHSGLLQRLRRVSWGKTCVGMIPMQVGGQTREVADPQHHAQE